MLILLIDTLKVIILLLVAFLVVSMIYDLFRDAELIDKKNKASAPRKVLTLEETRDVLWVNYIYHFHGGC